MRITGWLLIMLLALTSCGDPKTAPVAGLKDLAELDLTQLKLSPEDFCGSIPTEEVAKAVTLTSNDPKPDKTGWEPGEKIKLESGLVESTEEYGCRWESNAWTASAWIFANRITPGRATKLTKNYPSKGCRKLPKALTENSVALSCKVKRKHQVRLAGEINSYWFTCQLQAAKGGPKLVTATKKFCGDLLQLIVA